MMLKKTIASILSAAVAGTMPTAASAAVARINMTGSSNSGVVYSPSMSPAASAAAGSMRSAPSAAAAFAPASALGAAPAAAAAPASAALSAEGAEAITTRQVLAETVGEIGAADEGQRGHVITKLYEDGSFRELGSDDAIAGELGVSASQLRRGLPGMQARRGGSAIATRHEGGAMVGTIAAVGIVGALIAIPKTRYYLMDLIDVAYIKLKGHALFQASRKARAEKIMAKLEDGNNEYNKAVVDAKALMVQKEAAVETKKDAVAKAEKSLSDKVEAKVDATEAKRAALAVNVARKSLESAASDLEKAVASYQATLTKLDTFFRTSQENLDQVATGLLESDIADMKTRMIDLESKYVVDIKKEVGGFQKAVDQAKAVAAGKEAAHESSAAVQQVRADDAVADAEAEATLKKAIENSKKGGAAGGGKVSPATGLKILGHAGVAAAALVPLGGAAISAAMLALAGYSLFASPKAATVIGRNLIVSALAIGAMGAAAIMAGSALGVFTVTGMGMAAIAAPVVIGVVGGGLALYQGFTGAEKSAPKAETVAVPAPAAPAVMHEKTAIIDGRTITAVPAVQMSILVEIEVPAGVNAGTRISEVNNRLSSQYGFRVDKGYDPVKMSDTQYVIRGEVAASSLDSISADKDVKVFSDSQMQPFSAAQGPSIGESLEKAGKAAQKIGGAVSEAVGAGVKQGEAAARAGLSKAAEKLEQLAIAAAQKSGAASGVPAAAAPSYNEILGRFANAGARLGDVAATAAEAGVTALENKLAQAKGDAQVPSAGSTFMRFMRFLKDAILFGSDVAMTKAEAWKESLKTPDVIEYQLNRMFEQLDKKHAKIVGQAAAHYFSISGEIDRLSAQSNEAKRKAKVVEGKPAAAVHESVVAASEATIQGLIPELAKAKLALDWALANRARDYADGVEKKRMARVGVIASDTALIQKTIAAEQASYLIAREKLINDFNKKVNQLVAEGRAAQLLAETDPRL